VALGRVKGAWRWVNHWEQTARLAQSLRAGAPAPNHSALDKCHSAERAPRCNNSVLRGSRRFRLAWLPERFIGRPGVNEYVVHNSACSPRGSRTTTAHIGRQISCTSGSLCCLPSFSGLMQAFNNCLGDRWSGSFLVLVGLVLFSVLYYACRPCRSLMARRPGAYKRHQLPHAQVLETLSRKCCGGVKSVGAAVAAFCSYLRSMNGCFEWDGRDFVAGLCQWIEWCAARVVLHQGRTPQRRLFSTFMEAPDSRSHAAIGHKQTVWRASPGAAVFCGRHTACFRRNRRITGDYKIARAACGACSTMGPDGPRRRSITP